MPVRLLVAIEPKVLHERGVWADTGPAIHGHLLTTVRRISPALADHLHRGAKGGQPFAVSPVLCRERQPDQWRFEVGVLDDSLADVFTEALESEPLVRIGHSSFVVSTVRPVTVRYEEIVARSRPATRWGLNLVTPLTFRTTGESGAPRFIPLPDAQLVFSRLRARFDRYSPSGALTAEVGVAIAEHLALASLELVSAMHLVKAPRLRYLGCTGTVTYTAVRSESLSDAALQAVDALVNFAAFAGVGDQTTKGMGVAVPFDPA